MFKCIPEFSALQNTFRVDFDKFPKFITSYLYFDFAGHRILEILPDDIKMVCILDQTAVLSKSSTAFFNLS